MNTARTQDFSAIRFQPQEHPSQDDRRRVGNFESYLVQTIGGQSLLSSAQGPVGGVSVSSGLGTGQVHGDSEMSQSRTVGEVNPEGSTS